jgi:hypothetical protein
MTPEGKVKKKIKAVLDKYKESDYLYYYMPVPGGFGAQSLDYIGWYHSLAFAIEAKREGGVPTARQEGTIANMRLAGARVFVIDGESGVIELDEWLAHVKADRGQLFYT